jgi:hypothetical protein
LDELTKSLVKKQIETVMDRVISRRITEEPFDSKNNLEENPFGARLVPEEIWKGSKFERSFVTSLGQGVFEQIGKIIAEGTGDFAENQHITLGKIDKGREEKIEAILRELRDSKRYKRKPDWKLELEEILSVNSEKTVDIKVNSDLYIKRQTGKEEFYSFKTAKPNLDQTERAKRDMFELWAMNPHRKVFFALPHNPMGEGREYNYQPPFKIFDMVNDPCVLIGSRLWDTIGGTGTYKELLDLFEEVGKLYIPTIKTQYLKIGDSN